MRGDDDDDDDEGDDDDDDDDGGDDVVELVRTCTLDCSCRVLGLECSHVCSLLPALHRFWWTASASGHLDVCCVLGGWCTNELPTSNTAPCF